MTNEKDQQASEVDVEVILAAVDFPATKDELVDAAEGAEMDRSVVVFFEALPDRRYSDRSEIDKAIDEKKGDQKEMADQKETSSEE